ncbi:hypothetical protein ONZ43_g64 [Nemania bipapillata]|uniref:Uncharacterized protein n=1 Tax=Nemania bipapillata TaxID=110536 RepID=A0ACC2J9I7_9PEZI|nr:hypothetical protein ONZ43_g64 [Nemania bipapillata]
MSKSNSSEPEGSRTVLHLPPSNPQLITKIPNILPHERVFPVQIGSELFKLSGASLSSDAPSYFSQYFLCQIKRAEESGEDLSTGIRTLYIDRDPTTFRDIALHLQGYHVTPRDGTHFVRLFADAQFYTLPKLMSRLYEESIFISIGHREFQIPRDMFTGPGNSPNFFSLGFGLFFSSPKDLYPGLDRNDLIRPPSIMPPSVPNRSADTFAELLQILRGYPIHIRDEEHRTSLLQDCRYFNFKALEQKLLPHHISYNQARRKHEILMRVEDIFKSGVSVVSDSSGDFGANLGGLSSGWVNYMRPYEDDKQRELVLEIGGETTKLHLNIMRAEFFGQIKTRIARLFEVIAAKLNLPTTQPLGLLMASGGADSQPPTPGNTALSEDLVRISLDPEAHITLDGKPYVNEADNDELATAMSTSPSIGMGGEQESPVSSMAPSLGPSRKRRRVDASGQHAEEWVVRTGQWRLRIQSSRSGKSPVECVLVAVKIDAYSAEQTRNAQRGFLMS